MFDEGPVPRQLMINWTTSFSRPLAEESLVFFISELNGSHSVDRVLSYINLPCPFSIWMLRTFKASIISPSISISSLQSGPLADM